MKRYKINVTQRTATRQDQSGVTDIFIVCWTNNGEVFAVENVEKYMHGVSAEAYRVVAAVNIKHPAVMAGSCEEISADFCRRALQEIERDGRIESNDYGVKFWIE